MEDVNLAPAASVSTPETVYTLLGLASGIAPHVPDARLRTREEAEVVVADLYELICSAMLVYEGMVKHCDVFLCLRGNLYPHKY